MLTSPAKIFLPGLQPRPRFGKRYEVLVLSYGGGQDSTALLLRLIFDDRFRKAYSFNRLLVLMSDTGNEHDHTYRFLNEVIEPLCAAEGIAFHFLANTMGFHSPTWPDLVSFYERTHTCGSKGFRHNCSVRLKIETLYRYLEAWLGDQYELKNVDPRSKRGSHKRGFYEFTACYGPVGMMIGFSKGEEGRRAPVHALPRWSQETVERIYPLIDLGLDRAACQQEIAGWGLEVPFPSACLLCPYQSETSLLWLYRNHPNWYERWVQIEAAKLEKFAHLGGRNLGVWPHKTLPEVLEKELHINGALSKEALDHYKMNNGHNIKTQY